MAEGAQDDLKDTTTTDAADQAAPGAEDQAAPPGGEQNPGEDAAPKSALEAARAVMAKGAKDAAAEKPQGESQPAAKADADKTAKPNEAEFDDPSLPFKDHPAYKKWASEHRILKVAKEKNEQAIAQMEPRVKAHDALLNFFDTNGLKQDDVAQGLTIMAAVRNDPAKAYELLAPIVEELRVAVGEKIPADIQARIEGGLIDEASGRELAKQRAAAELARQQSTHLATELRAVLDVYRQRKMNHFMQEDAQRHIASAPAAEDTVNANLRPRVPRLAPKGLTLVPT